MPSLVRNVKIFRSLALQNHMIFEIKNRTIFVSMRWFCPPTRKNARVPRRKLVFCVLSTEPHARLSANRAQRDLRETARVVL